MKLLRSLLCGTVLLAWPVLSCEWPLWQQYKAAMMSPDGRILDNSSPQKITTSEGQSYGLFFALVANDQAAFAQLLDWTVDNLAAGDLSARLPAWQWGKNAQGHWGVLDTNNASDSDLWLAYSLLEAGRLWKKPDYSQLGRELLWRSAAQSLIPMDGLALGLLPGNRGFASDTSWKLNPSYLPLQLLTRFSAESRVWQDVRHSSHQLLLDAAPKGLAPDWLMWSPNTRAAIPAELAKGSYDAIRVYLWLGMLHPDTLERAELLAHYQPMLALLRDQGTPPEEVNSLDGSASGTGPVGFSAALLPMLSTEPQWQPELAQQLARIEAEPLAADAYYNQSLLLFGLGWLQGQYHFDEEGQLHPVWLTSCD